MNPVTFVIFSTIRLPEGSFSGGTFHPAEFPKNNNDLKSGVQQIIDKKVNYKTKCMFLVQQSEYHHNSQKKKHLHSRSTHKEPNKRLIAFLTRPHQSGIK